MIPVLRSSASSQHGHGWEWIFSSPPAFLSQRTASKATPCVPQPAASTAMPQIATRATDDEESHTVQTVLRSECMSKHTSRQSPFAKATNHLNKLQFSFESPIHIIDTSTFCEGKTTIDTADLRQYSLPIMRFTQRLRPACKAENPLQTKCPKTSYFGQVPIRRQT